MQGPPTSTLAIFSCWATLNQRSPFLSLEGLGQPREQHSASIWTPTAKHDPSIHDGH